MFLGPSDFLGDDGEVRESLFIQIGESGNLLAGHHESVPFLDRFVGAKSYACFICPYEATRDITCNDLCKYAHDTILGRVSQWTTDGQSAGLR